MLEKIHPIKIGNGLMDSLLGPFHYNREEQEFFQSLTGKQRIGAALLYHGECCTHAGWICMLSCRKYKRKQPRSCGENPQNIFSPVLMSQTVSSNVGANLTAIALAII
jgi:hypothetical protein